VEEALFDCFNLERLCKEQVHAMMYASPFRELSAEQVEALRVKYEATRDRMVNNYYEKHVKQNKEITPIAGAWNGKGEVPLTFGVYGDQTGAALERGSNGGPQVQSSFMRHMVSEDEWSVRVDMAAVCRLLSRLNGHTTYEGSFAHFSYDLGDGTYLAAPADIPFAGMRASHIVVCDAEGTVLRGEGTIDADRFQAFNRMRHAGSRSYPMLLFTHTTFTDRLAQHGEQLRMISQTAFNFADEAYSYFDAWGHNLEATSDFTTELTDHIGESDKVFIMLSHGGCIARGEDAAHVFSLVHGVDAAAEIQVYAEMTGFPLAELPKAKVRDFPRHGYGDMRGLTKRMVQSFAANKRMLLVDWNQGFRNTGDSVFVL